MDLVNFSFCGGVITVAKEMLEMMTYFQNYETLTSLAPSDNRLIGRVFEHSRVVTRLATLRINENQNPSPQEIDCLLVQLAHLEKC
jgi:hypothetical protein